MSNQLSEIPRGNLITWTQSFRDADGNPVTPTTATLYVSYQIAKRAFTVATIAMSQNPDNSYSASWDSSPAFPGVVNWSIKSAGPSSATDGFLVLTANAANLATA